MSNEEYMLTTTDNPFDPFDQFKEWYSYDLMLGYNTLGYLARIVVTSPELSPADQKEDIVSAMNEIVEHNIYGVHKIVSRTKTDG